MAANPRSFAATDAYRERVEAILARITAFAETSFDPDDPDWPARFATALAQAQAEAVAVSAGYLSAFLSLEYGRALRGPQMRSGYWAGVRHDGSPIGGSYVAPAMLRDKVIEEGGTDSEARQAAITRLGLMVEADLMAAARDSLHYGVITDPRIRGWRRAVKGTCSACMGDIQVETSVALPSYPLNVHPNCKCVMEPVCSDVSDQFLREDGQERFDKMSKNEQDAALGQEAAMAVRQRYCKVQDLVVKSPTPPGPLQGRLLPQDVLATRGVAARIRTRALQDVLTPTQLRRVRVLTRQRRAALKAAKNRALNLKRSRAAKKGWQTRRTGANPLTTSRLNARSLETFDSGTSTAQEVGIFRGTLANGQQVFIKPQLSWHSLRDQVTVENGMYHAQASVRVADALGLPTPRAAWRTLGDLGDDAQRWFLDNGWEWARDRNVKLLIQEFMDPSDLASLPYTIEKGTAERFSLLDWLIGNTDRHHRQWDLWKGRVTALDHDLVFPRPGERGWGNLFDWVDRATGGPLEGSRISPDLMRILKGMQRDRVKWRKLFREDGITGPELDAFEDRLDYIVRKGVHVNGDTLDGPGFLYDPQRWSQTIGD